MNTKKAQEGDEEEKDMGRRQRLKNKFTEFRTRYTLSKVMGVVSTIVILLVFVPLAALMGLITLVTLIWDAYDFFSIDPWNGIYLIYGWALLVIILFVYIVIDGIKDVLELFYEPWETIKDKTGEFLMKPYYSLFKKFFLGLTIFLGAAAITISLLAYYHEYSVVYCYLLLGIVIIYPLLAGAWGIVSWTLQKILGRAVKYAARNIDDRFEVRGKLKRVRSRAGRRVGFEREDEGASREPQPYYSRDGPGPARRF